MNPAMEYVSTRYQEIDVSLLRYAAGPRYRIDPRTLHLSEENSLKATWG